MGQTKQLLQLGDCTVLEHCIKTIMASGVTDIIVVLGSQADGLLHAVRNLPVRTVFNAEPESEMIESARIGLRALDPASTGLLIMPADHPLVKSETLRALINLHAMHPESIIIPSFRKRRGHPTLFPRIAVHDINVKGTLREAIGDSGKEIVYLDVDDEGVLLDMDYPGDYETILRRFSG